MHAYKGLVIGWLAAAVLLTAPGALAQAEVCINPTTGQIDQQATQGWNYVAQSADQAIMSHLVGAWRSEITNPFTGQIDFRTSLYEPNGAFQYQSQVCDATRSYCSPFSGHGLYAARSNGGGDIMLFFIVSDLSRDRVCSSVTVRFLDADTLVEANGQRSVRVR